MKTDLDSALGSPLLTREEKNRACYHPAGPAMVWAGFCFCIFFNFVFLFQVAGIEPRGSCVLSKHLTTELDPQPWGIFSWLSECPQSVHSSVDLLTRTCNIHTRSCGGQQLLWSTIMKVKEATNLGLSLARPVAVLVEHTAHWSQ